MTNTAKRIIVLVAAIFVVILCLAIWLISTGSFKGYNLLPITAAPEAPAPSVSSINLGLRTGGQVENNMDDGNATMGTIMLITHTDPSTDPTLFLVAPGYSIDVEYLGLMFFTTDRFAGSANLDEAVKLASDLHPEAKTRLFVGPKDKTPAGYTFWQDAQGWWTLRDWKYSETPIEPQGLTATPGIFVSETQKQRTLVASEGVIYGQFWTTANPGHVVHVQIRAGRELTIPMGWQGTYWLWTGDFVKGELDLQKRIIQASAVEVGPRDDIVGFTLLACGPLPAIDPEIMSFKFHDATVTWISSLDGWTCK